MGKVGEREIVAGPSSSLSLSLSLSNFAAKEEAGAEEGKREEGEGKRTASVIGVGTGRDFRLRVGPGSFVQSTIPGRAIPGAKNLRAKISATGQKWQSQNLVWERSNLQTNIGKKLLKLQTYLN